MRLLSIASLLLVASLGRVAAATESDEKMDATCRQYFGAACSEAVGRWLPRVPFLRRASDFTTTSVSDEIVDPAGMAQDDLIFAQRGVARGTFFVYGSAGPPRGHVVYDPIHRFAFYDEGCCSWHHVVLASDVSPPPKAVAMRSLAGVRTLRGLRLGDSPRSVFALYGAAPLHSIAGATNRQTISYRKPLAFRGVLSTCEADTTFLFIRNRIVAMDFYRAC